MRTFLTLDVEGLLLAVVFGIAIILLGGSMGVYFFGVSLLFLVLSAIVTWIGNDTKKAMRGYEKSRGWRNVVANGLPQLIVAAAYFADLTLHFIPLPVLVVSYVASAGAITADKFASELGILSNKPTEIVTMRKVRKGVSGGVTGLGTFAGMFGAFLIGLTLLAVHLPISILVSVGVVVVSSAVGNLIDSVLGHFEEEGVGNKFTSNFVCGVSGWLVSLLLLMLA